MGSISNRMRGAVLFGLVTAFALSPVHAESGTKADAAPQTAEETNWLTQQIRRFRSHPHLDRGYRLEQAGKLKEARAEMAKALAVDPGNQQARIDYVALLERLKAPEDVLLNTEPLLKHPDRRTYALLTRARAYRSLNRFEEASAELKLVVAAENVAREQRLYAADALVDLELKRGRYQEASLALDLLPDNSDFRNQLRRGIINDALTEHTDAKQNFEVALSVAGDSADRVRALEYLGHNALKRTDWTRARDYFDEALALDPRNVDLMRALVEAAYRAGHAKYALRWAGEVMTISPTPADKEVVANLRYATADYPGAVREYEELLPDVKVTDDRARIFAAIGYAYFNMDRYAEASRSFEEASKLSDDPQFRKALETSVSAAHPPQFEQESLESLLQKPPTPQLHMRIAHLYLEQGDEAQAVQHLEQATEGNSPARVRAAAYRTLWPTYYTRGNRAAARTVLEKLVTLVPKDADALRALAHIDIEEGDAAKAVEHLRRSVSVEPGTEAYRSLAYALALVGDWRAAIDTNRALLALPGLPASDRAEAYEKIARAQIEQGDQDAATKTLQEALSLGIDNAFVRERLGLALSAQRRWDDALVHFRALHERAPNPMASLYLSRCYSALKKTGLAVHYGRLALQDAEELPESERAQLRAELAYLYADESEYASAAKMWKQVMERNPSAMAAYHYGVAEQRAGNVAAAREAWESIADGVLSKDEEVERLNSLGMMRSAEGDLEGAIKLYARADALAPGAYNQYRIGLALQETGKAEEALVAFETAFEREAKPGYALALGYAYVNAKRFADAAQVLEQASALDPENLALYQDVAYAHLHSFNNDKAIEWFKRGIDARLAQRQAPAPETQQPAQRSVDRAEPGKKPADVDASLRPPEASMLLDRVVDPNQDRSGFKKMSMEPRQAIVMVGPSFETETTTVAQAAPAIGLPQHADPELERMRDEVRRLEKNWNFTFYQAYSPAHERTDAGVASTGGSVVPSQGGIEISYRPPVVGFRDERIFDIYARALWSNEPRSLEMESDSLQGGIGLRYKPFRATQFYVSGERLFKIGTNAQNTWLLRASYGWTDMADNKLGETNWNYTSFYGDVGYFTDDDNTRAFYGEARQGRTFKMSDQWIVSPHVVVNGRYEQPNFSPGSYWQAGAGVSVKYLFNATRYASYRSNIEVLLHYKVGMAHVASGWLLTFVARI